MVRPDGLIKLLDFRTAYVIIRALLMSCAVSDTCHETANSVVVTLKALANFSPGFALKPWDHASHLFEDATLKELRQV